MLNKASRPALKLALIYIVASGCWILFSDELLERLVKDADLRVELAILKGWIFVAVTGGILFFTVRRILGNWLREIHQRERAEAALLESQERYVLAEHAVEDGLWDWNILTGDDYFSPRWKGILGYSDNELPNLKSTFFGLVHPEDAAAVHEATRRHLEKDERYAIEFRMRHKDGSYRWVYSRGQALRDAAGCAYRMVGAITDITERKRMEESIRENEVRFHQLADNITDVFWIASLDFKKIHYVSPGYELVWGLKAEGVYANPRQWLEAVLPEDRERVAAAFALLRKNQQTTGAVEYRIARPDGSVRWIYDRGFQVNDACGNVVRLAGLASDITERKLAESALRENEAKFRAIFNNNALSTIVIEPDSTISMVNDAYCRVSGYPREEAVGRKWQWAIVPEDLPRLLDYNRRRLFNPQDAPDQYEFRYYHKSGEVRQSQIAVALIQGSGQIIASMLDITERKLAVEKLRESEERYRNLFQNMNEGFAYCRMIIENNQPKDFVYLEVNEMFTTLTGLKDVAGRRVTEVIPDIREVDPEVFEIYGRVALTGTPERLERHVKGLQLWLDIAVYSTEPGFFVVVFDVITKRKAAEKKLRESEVRYRQLFEMESDAVILVDCETRHFVDVNQSAQQLYGHTREEFLQMTVDLVSGEPDKCDAKPNPGNKLIPLRWHQKKNGDRFAVEISSNIITHRGRLTELATVRDITARRQVMDMLSETTQQLLEAQRVAGLGSYVFDVRADRWTGSDVLGEIFGLLEPGVARDANAWLDLVHPDDRPGMKQYLTGEILKNRARFDRIYRIVRANDGQERWVHGLGKLVLDEQGEILRMVGVIQDITERQRNEEQMNVQSSALMAAANAIVITGRNGRIQWVNPAFSKLTGYDATEAIGKTARILKSSHHPPSFYVALWNTILSGNVWHGDILNQRKDGQVYTEEMTITPVRGTDGQIAHFVAVKQDVTEKRQLEKRMQQAQKMEAIGTLAGGIAHDFNNILAAMFGYAYLLQQDTEGNGSAQESIAEILKATGRAKDLVQQILTFSRQREQKPQVIRLENIVKEAVKFLRASLPAQIKIETNLADDVPAVIADPTQIYQVAINLATNALHAMEGQSGQLAISLERFQPDARAIQSHPEFQNMTYARMTVSDSGHGMDAATLERIFEPFFTTKPIGKGTGLGLAVVHGIVKSHQGVITVNSEIGRGTTFQLYFPGERNGALPAMIGDKPVPSGRGQRILLLDDEPTLTTALRGLLVRLNYQVTTSNSAHEVVGWCRENPAGFDLVITDLTMPEMTGIEVARRLHALRPTLPVILTSGFIADINREQLDAAGICEMLQKPVSRSVLAEVIERALARPKNGAATHQE